jgi:hypothetical protein
MKHFGIWVDRPADKLTQVMRFLKRWQPCRKLADEACELSVFSRQFSVKTIDA